MMRTTLSIEAEPVGEFYETAAGWMVRFPYPEGVRHHVVEVPEPWQTGEAYEWLNKGLDHKPGPLCPFGQWCNGHHQEWSPA